MKIKTSASMTQIKKNKEYFESALKTPLVINSRSGQFILCSREHINQFITDGFNSTVTKTQLMKDPQVIKRAIHNPVVITNKKDSYVLIHYDQYVGARQQLDDSYSLDVGENTIKPKTKFKPTLSKRVGAARAWDDHAFLEADGMWTDVREEIMVLERKIESLEERLAAI